MKIVLDENIVKKIINEENIGIEQTNNTYKIPDKLFSSLKQLYNSVKDDQKYTTLDGYKRLQNYIEADGYLSYDWLRRVKHFFDHYKGKTSNIIYKLNGGDGMKFWVDGKLKEMREKAESSEKMKQQMGFSKTIYKGNLSQSLGNNENSSINYK